MNVRTAFAFLVAVLAAPAVTAVIIKVIDQLDLLAHGASDWPSVLRIVAVSVPAGMGLGLLGSALFASIATLLISRGLHAKLSTPATCVLTGLLAAILFELTAWTIYYFHTIWWISETASFLLGTIWIADSLHSDDLIYVIPAIIAPLVGGTTGGFVFYVTRASRNIGPKSNP